MPLFLRSRTLSQPLVGICCGVLSALLLLAPAAEAAPKRASKSSKSKAGAAKTTPEASGAQSAPSTSQPSPAEAPAAAAAPASESKPAEESRPVVAAKPSAEPARLAPTPRQAPRPAAAPKVAATEPLLGGLRVGVGGDLFAEGARMSGEQGINTSRFDESFDYSSASFMSATAWMSTSVPSTNERLRMGAGLRIFGNYGGGGGRDFGFGLLNEAFVTGEYGLPVADQMEVLFGARAGLAFLLPGRELEAEIRRLQEQGVGVWNVPRVGWLAGPSVGARRRMSDRIWLRADLAGQAEQLFLFATTQDISGFRFTKNWSTLGLRLGLTLGAEFAL